MGATKAEQGLVLEEFMLWSSLRHVEVMALCDLCLFLIRRRAGGGAKYPLTLELNLSKFLCFLNLSFIYLLCEVKYVLTILPMQFRKMASIPFTLYCNRVPVRLVLLEQSENLDECRCVDLCLRRLIEE